MEFEIDELAWECWEEADDQSGSANHAPRWTRDCMQKQTGEWLPEESIQVDLELLVAN